MLRLRTFGGLSIERTDGPPPRGGATSARRRLALLAVLAASEQHGVPRDRLVALFWPESDNERARHALDQSLYSLKRELACDELFVGREELSLNAELIGSDVADFRRALDRGDRAKAVELYEGPFLDGVYVPGAAELERWIDDQRARLARQLESALESLATAASERGDHLASVMWWQRLAALDPRKTRVVVALMSELAASGDRVAALRQAEVYATLARDDLEVEPNPAVAALADRLRREPTPQSIVAQAAVLPRPASPSPTVLSPTAAPASPDTGPPFADRYVIEREIGWGGTATVYLARDLHNDRRVALKVLRAELAAGVGVERFRREIAVTANLQHPHILPVHDSGEADGTLYFVMPFVEGESLRARLERERRLSVSEVTRLAQEIASALAYAHARGVVHRDVKPENILITSGHAIVADFGLARALDDPAVAPRAPRAPRTTGPGTVVGTPAYLSPEQATGDPDIDARSDQYTLAALLYEALAGTPPFAVDPANPLGRYDIAPASLRSRRSDVPDHVDRAILRALSADPAHRFDDVATFARALSIDVGAMTSSIASPLPASEVAAPRRRVAWLLASRQRVAAIAVAAAVVLVASGWLLMHRPALSERASIIVAEFDNHTQDSTLDRAIDAALGTALAQSAYVTSVPDARIRQTLAAMGRDTNDAAASRLTESVAREVAVRQGVSAVIAGSIDPVGPGFLLSAKLVDASTGTALVAEQRTAKRADDVIDALDDLVRQLRRDIGESRSAIARHDRPLPLATTRSLDALRKYADGLAASRAGNRRAAMELWNAAIALDSDFAMAHADLGIAYYVNNDRPAGDLHFDRALRIADRLTDRERLHVRAAASSWRGDREGAIHLRLTLLAEYPDEPNAWAQIGYDYMRLGRAQASIDAYRHQMALRPLDANDYVNLALAFKQSNQLDSTLAAYRRAFALRPALLTYDNLNHEYGIALVLANHLDDARAAYAAMLRGSRDQQARGHRSLGLLAMYRGHYDDAIDHFHRAVVASQTPRHELTEARNRLYVALAQQSYGGARRDSARAELRAAYALFRRAYIEPSFLPLFGVPLARDGQVSAAREILDSLQRRMQPNNAADQREWRVLAGEVALAAGNADSAVRTLSAAYAADSTPYVAQSLAYVLAAAGRTADAARTYQTLANAPDRWYGVEAEVFALTASLDAARLYERLGDRARARAAYADVVAQWPSADADLPPLRDARAALARLGGS